VKYHIIVMEATGKLAKIKGQFKYGYLIMDPTVGTLFDSGWGWLTENDVTAYALSRVPKAQPRTITMELL
jgi:hypothetical protein